MLLRVSTALVVLVLAVVGGAWGFLRASLPQLDGTADVVGLSAPATVERDSLGVVRITAAGREDAVRALGFVHAQERFFQMDLLRRAAAGELAALVGERAVGLDRDVRVYRFRQKAREAIARDTPAHRALVEAYAEGVNAGLAALGARPFEYAVLRQTPEPWRPEDTGLVVFAMTLDLQQGQLDAELQERAEALGWPAALDRFLDAFGDRWDAPLVGEVLAPPPLPTPDSLGGFRPGPPTGLSGSRAEPARGSNNWAVAGRLTETGAAMVADDMHLGLRLPNIWFRALLAYPGPDGTPVEISGVTLPGAPGVVVGSNGHVAWGFTNSYGDWTDLVQLVPVEGRPGWVQAASGPARLDTLRETLAVAGGDPVTLAIVQSPWGPVRYRDGTGAAFAVQWVADQPGGVSLDLFDLDQARTLADAFEVANRSGIPAQNFVAGDRAGAVGWTIAGRLPDRRGRDGRTPVLSTDPDAAWAGLRPPSETPRLVDPADGLVWTANNRVVDGAMLDLVGRSGFAHGARAQQIRDDLRRTPTPIDERDLLAIQLDDRAVFLTPWHDLLLDVLDDAALAGHPDRQRLRQRVEAWGGSASVASPGYGPVRAFHDVLQSALTRAYAGPVRAVWTDVDAISESALWRLVTERPAWLLPAGVPSWREALLQAADAAAEQTRDAPTWGDENRAAIAHPLAAALPGLGDALRMPADPLAGDADMPRVVRPDFGASERMVVSPGFEARGLLHMPGGQAGHPLSPYWGAGHDAWVEGRPLPFLPGRAVWTLTLQPG